MAKSTTPEYKSEFYERPGENPEVHRIVYKVSQKPIYKFTKKELSDMLTVIQREVRARISELRKAGLENDSPAYLHLKQNNISVYKPRSGNINAYRKALRDSIDFLHTKTSVVEGAKEYSQWTEEHIGVNLTKSQKRTIWKNIHKAEKEFSNKFEIHGYGYIMQRIAQESKNEDGSVSKLNIRKLQALMNKLEEEKRAEKRLVQKEVEHKWNKGEDLQKEYDNL